MAKNKTIDLQLSEVDLQALESIGVISVQNNIETGISNSNANFRRAISWLANRDCAMITAWRKEKKDGTPKTRAENNNDNKTLVQKLREYGYGVSKVQGCYAEVGHPLSRENSFLVFDLLNNSKLFFERLFYLSADFEQDSFLYKKAGETTPAYEIGTNEKFGMNKRKLAGVLRIGVEPKGAFSKIGSVQSLLNSYLLNAKQKIGVVAIYDNALRLYITFISKDFIISIQLTDSPILGNLEIEVIFLAIHRGWPELCFY